MSSVNHPAHYNVGKVKVIDAIEAWGLDFALGNVVKYVARAGHKGQELEDLKKAQWYLARAVQRMEPALTQQEAENLRDEFAGLSAEIRDAFKQGYTDGQDDERAAMVAWLREQLTSDKETAKHYLHAEGLAYWRGVIEATELFTRIIESGEHRKVKS